MNNSVIRTDLNKEKIFGLVELIKNRLQLNPTLAAYQRVKALDKQRDDRSFHNGTFNHTLSSPAPTTRAFFRQFKYSSYFKFRRPTLAGIGVSGRGLDSTNAVTKPLPGWIHGVLCQIPRCRNLKCDGYIVLRTHLGLISIKFLRNCCLYFVRTIESSRAFASYDTEKPQTRGRRTSHGQFRRRNVFHSMRRIHPWRLDSVLPAVKKPRQTLGQIDLGMPNIGTR